MSLPDTWDRRSASGVQGRRAKATDLALVGLVIFVLALLSAGRSCSCAAARVA